MYFWLVRPMDVKFYIHLCKYIIGFDIYFCLSCTKKFLHGFDEVTN